jgi:DNA-binding transcriptional regulator GbsR (MarR family)
MAASNDSAAQQAELDVADTIGQLMQFWGFKRPMGRLWTLLYLSRQPLAASELGVRARMSPGAVSLALGELIRWGAARRTWQPGERRDFFEAETDIWKLVRRVLRERELVLVRDFGSTLSAAEDALARAPTHPDLAFKRDRVEKLRELARVGETLLAGLVEGKAIDPAPIRKAAGGEP